MTTPWKRRCHSQNWKPRLPAPDPGPLHCKATSDCKQVGVCPSPTKPVLRARPELGAGDPEDQMCPTPLPGGLPSWGWDRRGSHSRVANRFLSSSAGPGKELAPEMGHLGPGPQGSLGQPPSGLTVSGPAGAVLAQGPASRCLSHGLSAWPKVTWSLPGS